MHAYIQSHNGRSEIQLPTTNPDSRYFFTINIVEPLPMYCINCAFQLPDIARFCSKCGAAQAGITSPTPGEAPSVETQAQIQNTQPVTQPLSPPSDSSVLLNSTGYPQPAFERLVAALFQALDQTIEVSFTFLTQHRQAFANHTQLYLAKRHWPA